MTLTLVTEPHTTLSRPDGRFTALLVRRTLATAIATRVATVAVSHSHDHATPRMAGSVAAAREDGRVSLVRAGLDEFLVPVAAVTGWTVVSRELMEDDRLAGEVVAQGLARDLARRVDAAFFGDLPAPAPAGLAGLPAASVVTGACPASLGPFAQAVSVAETSGARLTAFVTNPTIALRLAKIKGPADSGERSCAQHAAPVDGCPKLLGLPLYVSPHVAGPVVWGIPREGAYVVVREGQVEVSGERGVASKHVGVRGTMHAGFRFSHPAATVKIQLAS